MDGRGYELLFADEHLLVINKECGLLTVPGIGPEKADCLIARLQKEWLPKGLIRLLPTGMRPPPKAYDDYVAALLAEDWLLAQKHKVEVGQE